eukprot:2307033-Rhodomonas_salina.1
MSEGEVEWHHWPQTISTLVLGNKRMNKTNLQPYEGGSRSSICRRMLTRSGTTMHGPEMTHLRCEGAHRSAAARCQKRGCRNGQLC